MGNIKQEHNITIIPVHNLWLVWDGEMALLGKRERWVKELCNGLHTLLLVSCDVLDGLLLAWMQLVLEICVVQRV